MSLLCDVEGFGIEGRLQMHHCPPSFLKAAYLSWLYMDDYATAGLLHHADNPASSPVAQHVEAARLKLQSVGLDAHKEQIAWGTEASLGIVISTAPHEVRILDSKMALLLAATRHLITLRQCTSLQLQRLLGHWVWASMCFRLALSVLSSCYQFVEAHSSSIRFTC